MWIYDLKYYWRKWKAKIVLLFLFLLVLFWFRFQFLGLIGNYLVCEDELQKVQVAFILGGNSQIRAEKAAEVYDLSISDHFICTGEHHNDLADYFEVPESEAALSKGFLCQMGVPKQNVEVMRSGTSTREEADYILEECIKKDWNKIGIISDLFHTRRINTIFRDKFKENGIEIVIIGVENHKYDEKEFWKDERGTVMVFMEYIKLLHYYLT